jgi:hypothetical protein
MKGWVQSSSQQRPQQHRRCWSALNAQPFHAMTDQSAIRASACLHSRT